MRIALVSFDTRGGIQPYVALALGLQRAGHDVRVVAPADYGPMIGARGLLHHPLTGNVEAVLRGSGGWPRRAPWQACASLDRRPRMPWPGSLVW
jgi:UDP:flavonoid glycosyltransferase YjiC (YdhE family)